MNRRTFFGKIASFAAACVGVKSAQLPSPFIGQDVPMMEWRNYTDTYVSIDKFVLTAKMRSLASLGENKWFECVKTLEKS